MKYQNEYQQMHRAGMFNAWNKNYSDRVIEEIKNHIINTNSKTILDFGSGRGEQYSVGKIHEKLGIEFENVTCYDPGVPKFQQLPEGMFDGIISTDVFEHIPEQEVSDAVQYALSHANNFVYIVIFCGLAVKKFPDGTNVHVTVKPPRWWKSMFDKYNERNISVHLLYKWPTNPKLNILNL